MESVKKRGTSNNNIFQPVYVSMSGSSDFSHIVCISSFYNPYIGWKRTTPIQLSENSQTVILHKDKLSSLKILKMAKNCCF